MIKVTYENHGDYTFDSLADAQDDIIDQVVDEHDYVEDIVDTDTGKHYSCRWIVQLVAD